MKSFSFKEFKPTIVFLTKFVGLYFAGNLLYGIFITAYHPTPDPVTHVVSAQSASILNACGWSASIEDSDKKPTTLLKAPERSVLSVYEGCNGINTMIIFVAFMVAFGPLTKNLLWFLPTGLLIIHSMNLLRIIFLFFVAIRLPHFMYFTHKYLFTAILYVVIFLLWIWWVRKYSIRKT